MTNADRIRRQVQDIAKSLGRDASHVGDDDLLPQTGVLDSAGLLELIVWVETEFEIEIDQRELSLDNFGSIRRMTRFLDARAAA